MVKKAPELVAGCLSLPPNVALARILSAVAGILIDVRDQKGAKNEAMKRSGLYYLLKVSELDNGET